MNAPAGLKELRRTLTDRYARPDNRAGIAQVLTTLLPLAALWYGAALSAGVSYWLTAAVVALMSLFLVRAFVLMHECGHGSLFRTARLNRVFGFVFGVVSGMPQYVWSRHHLHHHATNGNWARYRGPLNVVRANEYAAMSARQQRRYRNARNIWLAPVMGFIYLIVMPRVTWLRGTVSLLQHVGSRKIARPGASLAEHLQEFKTPYCASVREYWHMLWNNVVLLGLWGLMGWMLGPLPFFICYAASMALAGGAAIVLFTVQHNFRHSYASGDEGWDSDIAAIEGTSYLVLPRWLHWFTANIGYHHVHHLSARIPNYRLAACHDEHRHMFSEVKRIRLSRIPGALKCILWDTRGRRIVSVAEYQRHAALPAAKAAP